MITLTTSEKITTVIGSAAQTTYDRFELTSITMDILGQVISGSCRLVSSGTPTAQAIQGSYAIPTTGSAQLQVSFPTASIFTQVALSPAQTAVVLGWITAAQNNIEGGLISVGAAAGVQAPGL